MQQQAQQVLLAHRAHPPTACCHHVHSSQLLEDLEALATCGEEHAHTHLPAGTLPLTMPAARSLTAGSKVCVQGGRHHKGKGRVKGAAIVAGTQEVLLGDSSKLFCNREEVVLS